MTQRRLEENPKFELMFQPTYYPWVNVIERLWKATHDTVTRNHRCRSMFELYQSVARFLEAAQPFLENDHAVAHLGSAIWPCSPTPGPHDLCGTVKSIRRQGFRSSNDSSCRVIDIP